MSFYKFATLFKVSNKTLIPRVCKNKYEVIRTWPTYNGHSKSKQYPLHCKFQLIKYKPWTITPTQLITAFGYTEDTTDSEQLQMYVEAFKTYLTEDEARDNIPEFETEMRNALYANHVWNEEEKAEFHEIIQQNENQQEEWMQISNFHQIYEDESKEALTRSDWDTPSLPWTEHDSNAWMARLQCHPFYVSGDNMLLSVCVVVEVYLLNFHCLGLGQDFRFHLD